MEGPSGNPIRKHVVPQIEISFDLAFYNRKTKGLVSKRFVPQWINIPASPETVANIKKAHSLSIDDTDDADNLAYYFRQKKIPQVEMFRCSPIFYFLYHPGKNVFGITTGDFFRQFSMGVQTRDSILEMTFNLVKDSSPALVHATLDDMFPVIDKSDNTTLPQKDPYRGIRLTTKLRVIPVFLLPYLMRVDVMEFRDIGIVVDRLLNQMRQYCERNGWGDQSLMLDTSLQLRMNLSCAVHEVHLKELASARQISVALTNQVDVLSNRVDALEKVLNRVDALEKENTKSRKKVDKLEVISTTLIQHTKTKYAYEEEHEQKMKRLRKDF